MLCRNCHRGGSIGFALLGALLGAGLALLYAPQTGDETRKLLKKKALEAKKKALKMKDEALEKVEEFKEEAGEKAVELKKKAKRAAAEFTKEEKK